MPEKPNRLDQAFARRRRGAPNGNRNALKHGFYSRQFKPADLKDLARCQYTDLSDEIAVLRVQLRRVIELSSQAQTLTEAAFTLRALCLATLSINRLVRTQFTLGNQGSEVADALAQALEEIAPELETKNPALIARRAN
ncbi:MAG: hypothetical protein P4L50_25375 [Anaerolineaceae bacterium]|nr:hypothetical protein [Anaerolineaceae bacterium]